MTTKKPTIEQRAVEAFKKRNKELAKELGVNRLEDIPDGKMRLRAAWANFCSGYLAAVQEFGKK